VEKTNPFFGYYGVGKFRDNFTNARCIITMGSSKYTEVLYPIV